ncbi:unnamed protein product [Protopolystoma xenopodis]|uniref:Uncharacterized protein n=1 Tax=Protopolystoma xenopodis TaxID=117903 RepID=A0A3S5B804_9PLAT|nr:unnamed protein product [Protopolystoma xenopodis]
MSSSIPLVVRLEGNNVTEARALLHNGKSEDFQLWTTDNLDEAAQMAVRLTKSPDVA